MVDSSDEDQATYGAELQSKYHQLRQVPHDDSIPAVQPMVVKRSETTKGKKNKKPRAQSAKVRSPVQHANSKVVQMHQEYQNQQYILVPRPLPEQTEVFAQQRRSSQQAVDRSYNGHSSVMIPKHLIASRMTAVDFEPTKSYLYQEKKFKWQTQAKCDRVKKFQAMNKSWQSSKFLSANHSVHPNESREGRKLHLAEYNQKYRKPSVKKDPKNTPFNKLSSYVIPSQQKRDNMIYELRMKMARQSAISYIRPFSAGGPSKGSKKSKVASVNVSFNYKY